MKSAAPKKDVTPRRKGRSGPDPLVKELLSQIDERAQELDLTYRELTLKADPDAKGTSTWDGWRNGSSESPRCTDLERYANAVGLTVRLVRQDASSTAREDKHVPDRIDELVAKWRRLPSDAQLILVGRIEGLIETEAARHPLDPDAD